MKKKILVIGGSGYLGSKFCEYNLSKNHIVHCLDNCIYRNRYSILQLKKNSNFKFINFDIRKKYYNKTNYYAVVIFAGLVGDPITNKYKSLSKKINVDGIKKIINFYKNQNVRIIFMSTCSNYGFVKNEIATEKTKLSPKSIYAKQKILIEKYIISLKKKSKFCPTILRFSTAFGLSLRPRFDLTINEFVLNAFLRKKIEIYDHQTWRPYCHVIDFCKVINNFLNLERKKAYFNIVNVGSNENNFRKIDIAKRIKKIIPEFNYTIVKGSKDPRDYRVNFDKLSNLIGSKSFVKIDFGIKEIINFLKNKKNPEKFLKYGNYYIK
jgi:nucleoside-diphosphate-sugar epimerase